MKSKWLFGVAAALSLGAFSTFADTTTTTTTTTSWWSERMCYAPNTDRYHANELQLDLFGTYNHTVEHFDDIFDRSWHHGKWGGGVGMNYFFTKYVGIGVDTFAQENGHILNNVSGNVLARVPIGNSGFAPYVFGGAGWNDGSIIREEFKNGEFGSRSIDQLTVDGGVGIEYRFNPHLGVFSDIRYIWCDKTIDMCLVRAGFRIGLF